MTITRNDRNRTFDGEGNLVEDDVVVVDVTAETVAEQLRAKATNALAANSTFLALGTPTNAQVLAQTRLLTREVNAIIRLLLAGPLLDDTATDT